MQIIDVHAHIYKYIAGITQGMPLSSFCYGKAKLGNGEMQILPPAFEKSNSTVETLLAYMDWCGIDKALLMPNPLYGFHNCYFEESVQKYPDRFKGVALVDVLKGKRAAEELADIYDQGKLFGLKIEVDSTFQCAPDTHLGDEVLAPVWDCCNQYKQPCFIHMFRTEDIVDLYKFVLCHMGADACFSKGLPASNIERLIQLIKSRSNVYMDTSTVPVYFDEEYPWSSSVNIIEHCYQAVGAEKLMWASDYPGMLKYGTMQQLINVVKEHCKHITISDLALIMGENARRLFFVD